MCNRRQLANFGSISMVIVMLGGPAWVASARAEIVQPSRAKVSWELKFAFQDVQRLNITLPGDNEHTTYWYLLYRVENDTGRDVPFYPTAELVTSSLQVVEGGSQISPTVHDAIRKKHRVTHPFLARPGQVLGTLLQGEDNARTSMVVFRQFNFEDNAFTIYFSGLSGEIKRVSNPAYDASKKESSDNPRMFNLRKTLAIEYHLPGDATTRQWVQPRRENRTWVMR